MWEHPCDAYYRNLYEQLKTERLKRTAIDNTTKVGSAPRRPLAAILVTFLLPFSLAAILATRGITPQRMRG